MLSSSIFDWFFFKYFLLFTTDLFRNVIRFFWRLRLEQLLHQVRYFNLGNLASFLFQLL